DQIRISNPVLGRRPQARLRLAVECLEDRTLLATQIVDIVNFAFVPDPVTIQLGDTVHWVWENNNHSTTSVAGIADSWDSGVQDAGFTFAHTFTNAGSFQYYDTSDGYDNGNGTAGGMAGHLEAAIHRLRESAPLCASAVQEKPAAAFTPPPPLPHISEGSFFVGDGRVICQSLAGQSVPVVYGGTTLTAHGAMTGKRLAAL